MPLKLYCNYPIGQQVSHFTLSEAHRHNKKSEKDQLKGWVFRQRRETVPTKYSRLLLVPM